jgi:hypothetical protein
MGIIISNIKAGTGNQLFQYATALALSLKNNAELKLDLSFYDEEPNRNMFRLNEFNIDYQSASSDEISDLRNISGPKPLYAKVLNRLQIPNKYKKRTHIYDSNGFKPSNKIMKAKPPCYIEGWCVKEIYFKDIYGKLIQIFTPKAPISNKGEELLLNLRNSESVSVHIRRGDYINNSFFLVLPISYYQNAISYLSSKLSNPIFYFFSDDINWVKENFGDADHFRYVEENYLTEGPLDISDFLLMKTCRHNIIANSSFSWWAAYLNANENAIVISPRKWYGDVFYQSSIDKFSFIPKNWYKI